MSERRVRRVAVISLHTSPLLQPGSGDSGGMNVYVRELVSSLSQTGVECVTFTRSDREGLAPEVQVEPNHRVVHIEAGPHHLPKEALAEVSAEFCHGVMEWFRANGAPDVIHGNYWLSGVIDHISTDSRSLAGRREESNLCHSLQPTWVPSNPSDRSPLH